MTAELVLVADTAPSPVVVQLGVIVVAVGLLLTVLGSLGWVTLRVSGARLTPGTGVRKALQDNPYAAALAFLVRLLRPGLAIAAGGVFLSLLGALVDAVV